MAMGQIAASPIQSRPSHRMAPQAAAVASPLAAVKAAFGVEPIVYTAAFMSPTIGTSFAPYELWVANYATTCPTMSNAAATTTCWRSRVR